MAVLLGQGFLWLLALGVIAITRYWERKPLTSLGVRSLTLRLVLLGIGLGILLSVALPPLEIFANQPFPESPGGAIQDAIINRPVWLWLIVILIASVMEEVLFHAYPLERLTSLTGNMWLDAILSLAAFGDASATSQESLIEVLSERELEVLRLVALGKSNQQIADELALATGTVKKHLNNIFGKLNAQNRTECVARARELNLL